MTDRPDPLVDLECERALLGAVILDPVAYFEARGVTPETFGDPRNAVVWEAMTAIALRGDAIDSVSVLAAEIRHAGRLNAVGGAQYLSELTDLIPTSAHVPAHAELLVGLAAHRRARDTLTELARWASSPSHTPEEVLARVGRMALELSGDQTSEVTAAEVMMERLGADLTRPLGELPGIATPFDPLTSALGGWQPGQVVVVAARPSVGKTALALLAVLHAARAGQQVLVCSLETRELPLSRRLVAIDSGVELDQIGRKKPMGEREALRARSSMMRIRDLPLAIVQEPDQTLASICSIARKYKARKGLGLLVVDYLQLVKVTREKGKNREQEVAEISRGLKVLALSLGIPVVLLAQLSRDVEKEKRAPRLSDLRESGAIEQDADVVLFLHREGDPDPSKECDQVEVHAAKVKDGAAGTRVALSFHRRTTTYKLASDAHDAPPQYTPEPEGDEFGPSMGDAE